jgi:hypothetical protein
MQKLVSQAKKAMSFNVEAETVPANGPRRNAEAIVPSSSSAPSKKMIHTASAVEPQRENSWYHMVYTPWRSAAGEA